MSDTHATAVTSLLPARGRFASFALGALFVVGLYLLVAFLSWETEASLGNPSLITGYSLLCIMAVLASFNLRKRLSMLPLMRARWWTVAHICGGILVLGVFWLHTGTIWPQGLYEQALALAFYLVSLSGLAGVALQRLQPSRLTQTSTEIIYERIPNELALLRLRAEELVLKCTKTTGHDTLARYYTESLQWYFCAPRFVASNLRGSQRAEFWLEQRFATVLRYLNKDEGVYLEQLRALAEEKVDIDVHYAGQQVLRAWVFVHVPAATAVLTLAVWHLLLVHIYAL